MNKRLLVLLSFGCLFLSGCLFRGTGSGNPLSGDPNNGVAPSQTVLTLKYQICKLVADCNAAADEADCIDQVDDLTTYAPLLGLTDPYTVEEIIDAEGGGDIHPDYTAANLCKVEVSAWTCADTEVIAAYDVGLANPFSPTDQLLTPACAGIFAP